MSKRNSKSTNVASVVVVRCAALKMGVFSSSCSKLCNEWSLMCIRRAEAELRWFKRNREGTGTMQESTGTGHTAVDRIFVTAISILSAIFIVVLVYMLVLGQPFRFRRLEQAGTPSSTATSASWVHGPSKTRLLPRFLSTVRYNAGSNNIVADSAATGDARLGLETRRRSPYFHDRLGRAAALNLIDRSYSPRILAATPTGSLSANVSTTDSI